MGLVMISEGMLGEKVYTGTYSITANTTFAIDGTTLEKRENIEGATCTLHCLEMKPSPNSLDCTYLSLLMVDELVALSDGPFSLAPRMSRFPSWFIRRVMAPD